MSQGGGRAQVVRTLAWTPPLEVAAGLARRDGALCLLSDPDVPASRSFVAADPDLVWIEDVAPGDLFALLREQAFATGVIGLASYDAGARPATGPREAVWPDLMLARYPAMLVFDHGEGRVRAVGQGADAEEAEANCDRAAGWIAEARPPLPAGPPAMAMIPESGPEAYLAAVADIIGRIGAGELFQANIARGWTGTLAPGADPFDVFVRLATEGSAPYGAWWRMGDRALVSNSPELFVACDPRTRRVETRPIKGTRARDPDPVVDAANAAALLASAKDRAENLMIVDLLRNDLARACTPGSVRVERLFEVESHPTVHHLVSTVTGTLTPGLGPADVLEATFPPGSITGAPKHQAMKVIAGLEPPRGPWCGSLFVIDETGGLTASVLIRTAAFERTGDVWRFRTLAGAGIVADSDPAAEFEETEIKIAALRDALIGQQSLQPTVSTRRGRR